MNYIQLQSQFLIDPSLLDLHLETLVMLGGRAGGPNSIFISENISGSHGGSTHPTPMPTAHNTCGGAECL